MIMKLLWPLDKIYITQQFGANRATYAKFGLNGHDGIDLRTRWVDSPLGHRYVTAVADGVLEEIRHNINGYGIHIRQRLANGDLVIYGHLSKVYKSPKVNVRAGERIALSGNTGFSSAPHLHIEIRPKGEPTDNGMFGAVNPINYFGPIPK